MLTGYSINLPSDVLMDSGVLYVGTAIVGVSKGPWQFDPGREIVNSEFDGKHAPIKGLDRLFHGEPVISGTLIQFADSDTGGQMAKIEPGSSEADSGSTPNVLTTITPKAGGNFFASGDYLTDVRLIFERGIAAAAGTKKYAAIYLPCAIVKKWGPLAGANKDHPTYGVEIAGRKDMGSGTTADAAYKIEFRESLPA